MKTAIISDIHGNMAALERVLADIETQGAGEIICLGDSVGYGPEPEAVVAALLARGIASVKGNHELALESPQYLLRLNPPTRRSMEITAGLISRETGEFLRQLPMVLRRQRVRYVHGSPPASATSYLYAPSPRRLARLFAAFPERLCFFGHTHLLALMRLEEGIATVVDLPAGRHLLRPKARYLINVGSVGQPRDLHNRRAKYVLWEEEEEVVEVRHVPYDIGRTAAGILALGFPEYNAERLWGTGTKG